MKTEPRLPDKLFMVEGERIAEILRRAVRHALLAHKRAGNTIAVWKNEGVTLIPAEEIRVEADDADEKSTEV